MYHDYMKLPGYQAPHMAAALAIGIYEKPADRLSWGATLGALAQQGTPVLLTEVDEGDLTRWVGRRLSWHCMLPALC